MTSESAAAVEALSAPRPDAADSSTPIRPGHPGGLQVIGEPAADHGTGRPAPSIDVSRPHGLRRMLLAGVVGLVAFNLVAAGASSLGVVNTAMTPAQGSVTVAGPCLTSAAVSYAYVAADGTSAATLAAGTAYYVAAIVVTKTEGPGGDAGDCAGRHAAIAFSTASGVRPFVTTSPNPSFDGAASTWTFELDTTGSHASRDAIPAWDPGTITITVY